MRNRGLLLIAFILLLFSRAYSYEEIPLQYTPTSIAVNQFDNTAYAVSENSKIIYKVNLTSLSIISSYTFQDKPRDVAINGDRVYVPLGKDANGTLKVFDKNLNLLSTIDIGKSPVSIAVGNGFVAVACENDNTVYVISETSLTLSYSRDIGMKPNHIEIDKKRNEIIISAAMASNPGQGQPSGGKLFFIDLPTGNIKRTIDTVQKVKDLKINTLTDRIILTSAVNGTDIMNPDTLVIEKHMDLSRAGAADINQSTGMVVVLSPMTLNILTINNSLVSYFLPKEPNDVSINPYTNKAAISASDSLILFQLPNPIPEITNLIPESAKVGDSGFTLNVEGERFITTSTVQFNNNDLITTFIDNDTLNASVPSTLLTTPGTVPVTVTNPPPDGGTSNPYLFAIKSPAPVLSAIIPAIVNARSPDFTLRTLGTNFISGCVINLNGQNLATTYVSATELSGVVPSSLIATKGSYPVVVKTPDMQSSNVLYLTVVEAAPKITDFTPKEGIPGTVVTIRGENLNYTPRVSFIGAPATVLSPTATEIKTVVPAGAQTGLITVTTTGGSTQSAELFRVLSRQDFALNASPLSVSIPQSGNASFVVSLTSLGIESFTGLAKLSINNIPSGITAVFNPQYISSNQSSVLTVSLTSALTSQTTLNIDGTSFIDGADMTRTVNIILNPVSAGTTSLSGQVLATKDAKPIKGVTLRIGTFTTTTDDAGNFIFVDPPTGEQTLLIDGLTANTESASYPSALPVPTTITGGKDNKFPYQIYLHEVNTKTFTPIDSTKDTFVTDPAIPDYQMLIPAGTVITGWDGKPNEKVSVTTLPPDRLPIKSLPDGVYARTVFMYYFFKPGGGTPNRPVPVIMPNDVGSMPGERVLLWYYDESSVPDPNSNQWKPFGQGTVSEDGKSIIPDPGVGIPKFCCGASAYGGSGSGGPGSGGDNGCGESGCCGSSGGGGGGGGGGGFGGGDGGPNVSGTAGDPVDLATGYFIYRHTDYHLPGIIPVTINRHYRSGDPGWGGYGKGTYFGYDWWIGKYGDMLLLLIPGNYQYRFFKQPDGTYKNMNDPKYAGAVFSRNADGSYYLKKKDGWRYRFRSNDGLLDEIKDPNGNTLTFLREVEGNVTKIITPEGRIITLNVVILGRDNYTRITGPAGTVTYSYKSMGFTGQLQSVTYPDGSTLQYEYDSIGRMTKIIDARGNAIVTNEYDSNDRVIKQTHADGGIYTFSYTVAGGFVTETKMTDPNGSVTTWRFNNYRYISEKISPYGKTTYERAPGSNKILSVTDPLGRVIKYTYDQSGNITSITDHSGNKTLMEYDLRFDKPVKITNALGNVKTMAYDSKGNLISTTDPSGNTTTITYNSYGKPVSVIDAMGNTATLEYDEYRNLIKTTDPLGNTAQMKYDSLSRLIESTDPKGRTTRYAYDLMGRITEVTDASNGKTKYTYDPNGNLLTVTDAKNQTISYTYNVRNKIAQMTDQLARAEIYSYDLNDNLISVTNRKGQTTTYTYDNLNRITRATYADGSYTTYTYDAVGKLTYIYDSISGPIEYVYSNTGCNTGCSSGATDKVIQEITSLGSISYEYDTLGRRTSMTVAGQPTVNYGYDTNSRLTDINTTINGVAVPSFSGRYDALGRRSSLSLPNGVTTNYAYDNASRLLNLEHMNPAQQVLESLTYTYDPNGNRTSMNRVSANLPLPNSVTSITYNEANQMLQFDAKNLIYDENGNMTSVTNSCGTTNYTWDARNRLIGISGFKPDCTSLSASFEYDALGRRIEKTINGRTIQYLYDGVDIVQEIENGLVTVNYIRTLNIDEPLARIQADGTVRYYQADALGSVIALTDETGAVKTQYAYDPFGNVTISGESSDNPFQYTGRENDGTGLYYYRARYYSPELQRFISEDPILKPGNPYLPFMVPALLKKPVMLHAYNYVGNSPINHSDPMGLFWPIDCGKCIYYMAMCSIKGQECKEKQCNNDENTDSSKLWRECIQKIPECQKMIESCGKCGIGKK